MFTVTINLQISFDKENQAHSKELAQLVNEELKQSVQSIQISTIKLKYHPTHLSRRTHKQISLTLPTMKLTN